MSSQKGCVGQTRKGNPCKNRLGLYSNYDGYCHVHRKPGSKLSIPRCRGIKTNGKPCNIMVMGRSYCDLHDSLTDFDLDKSLYVVRSAKYIGYFDSFEMMETGSSYLQTKLEKEKGTNNNFEMSRYMLNCGRKVIDWNYKEKCYKEHKLDFEMSPLLNIKDLIDLVNEFVGANYIWCIGTIPCTLDYISKLNDKCDDKIPNLYLIKLNTLLLIPV